MHLQATVSPARFSQGGENLHNNKHLVCKIMKHESLSKLQLNSSVSCSTCNTVR